MLAILENDWNKAIACFSRWVYERFCKQTVFDGYVFPIDVVSTLYM